MFYICIQLKDYIEKCTAKYSHRPAVPWCPLSSLIIWWCWNTETSEVCSVFICTKPAWFEPSFTYAQSLDLCPTVPRPFQPKWVTMKNAMNVSLGEKEKQKPLSDVHIIECVNRRKIEVLCIMSRLLKQDKQHVHRSLPVRTERFGGVTPTCKQHLQRLCFFAPLARKVFFNLVLKAQHQQPWVFDKWWKNISFSTNVLIKIIHDLNTVLLKMEDSHLYTFF